MSAAEPLPGSKRAVRAERNGHDDNPVRHLYSLESEKAVLGCMLAQPDEVIPGAAQKLMRSDFFVPAHQEVFGVLCGLFRAQQPIDVMLVHQRLADLKLAEAVGSPGILAELLTGFATHLNVGAYIQRVVDHSAKRNLRESAESIIKEIDDNPDDIRQTIARAGESIKRVANLAAPDGVRKSRLTFRRVSELTGLDFDDTDRYMGERMLASGLNTVLAGPGGVGKSRLVMQMALCCITGRDFLSFPTFAKGKRWLIFQTENSNRRLSFDLRGMMKSFAPNEEESALIEDNFIIHTVETDDDAMMQVENLEQYKEMDNAIQDWRPAIVPFDPLNTFTFQDLNKDEGMREASFLISRLVKRGDPSRVPMILHHAITGKAGAAKAIGWDRSSFARNSKVLLAWARSQFNLAPRSGEDNSLLLLSCGKCSEGREFDPMGIKYDAEKCLYLIDQDFDLSEFKEEVSGETTPLECNLQTVKELARIKPVKRGDLVKLIVEESGISRAQAYRKIEQAEKKGILKENSFTRLINSI